MLFARFLAENGLLREYDGDQPIDLDECRALAADFKLDIWVYAAVCAQKMLPGVFRLDDPALELKLDGAAQVELNSLMAGMPSEIFKATDSLGWVYQYWQAKRKDEVNASGVKIGAKELSPVTQLFTEDYMVDFLLHNTLGAWWAGKIGPIEAATEKEARAKVGLDAKNGLPAVVWTYLRFIQNAETKKWTPAGGTFDGWPKKAKDITFLDPCMGSGHFPAFALPILARMRLEEEGDTAQENIHAVLKYQIHGLELDQRCCQIGAFNLALTAWKVAGFQQLPPLNVACCGIAPRAKLEDWVKLGGNDEKLKAGMVRLHKLFEQAPVLGSLINPGSKYRDFLIATYQEIRPILEVALSAEAGDEVSQEMSVSARGIAKAAELLASSFVLVATNVPYLGRGKQDERLRDYCADVHPEAKADLAACFFERCLDFCSHQGTAVIVTPQNSLFTVSYVEFRKTLLSRASLNSCVWLGEHAFESPAAAGAFTALIAVSRMKPTLQSEMWGLDVSSVGSPIGKAQMIISGDGILVRQSDQLQRTDAVISLDSGAVNCGILQMYAKTYQGVKTGDDPRNSCYFWEQEKLSGNWVFCRTSASGLIAYSTGMEQVLYWENNGQSLARRQGAGAWNKQGVLVSLMRELPASLYDGQVFLSSISPIIPDDSGNLLAIYTFCASESFNNEVRKIDKRICVSNSSLLKVPFDLEYWKKVAAEKFPNGIPKPFSSNPTQWLFNGHPYNSNHPLQVAVARLLCYQWPRQTGSSFPDCPALGPDGLEKYADDDGIVGLSSINREEAAAQRLRALLRQAYGTEWKEGVTERQLLADAGQGDSTLEEWLRDSFFEEHCKLFHHRPFVWHIWDGERDGFHALINYHRLSAPNGEGARLLQKLAQTYLGDWIARCEADVKNEKPNAHKLLKAAKDLQVDLLKILEGEAPNDIFVRWKTLHEQAIGWNPDINDGVRLNIRPFLTVRDVGKKGAGLLRFMPNIKWDKDRGSEPKRLKAEFPWFWSCMPEDKPEHFTDFFGGSEFTGERWNNLHYTLAVKKAARAKFTPKK